MHDRFFDSTRGKIVEALRSRHAASAFELAHDFGLSPNAIRQQLLILERDGLVIGKSVRRGKTKPTHEYSLTTQADRYFPQAYDRMLGAVLREVRLTQGEFVPGLRRSLQTGCAKRTVVGEDGPGPRRQVDAQRREADRRQRCVGSGVAVDVEDRGDTIRFARAQLPLSPQRGFRAHPGMLHRDPLDAR